MSIKYAIKHLMEISSPRADGDDPNAPPMKQDFMLPDTLEIQTPRDDADDPPPDPP